ncbi:hypothetical protein GCM10027046_16470 [Uliginosibacterium flavum]|uniref:Uncharacterized protein n=1 Tax=Uliginosibacterium flavum TaxID=1396831 RepID=A0ABV2TP22_9RHOO
MTIFAFHVADACLHVFASPALALQHCSAAEVSAQVWLFFAEDGSPLRVEQGLEGMRFLRPWASCSSCSLAQLLPYVRTLEGQAGVETLDALRRRFGAELA